MDVKIRITDIDDLRFFCNSIVNTDTININEIGHENITVEFDPVIDDNTPPEKIFNEMLEVINAE